MARTLILRPYSDISVNHSKSSGSNGYTLIYDETADDSSTYIYQSQTSTSSTVTAMESTFGCTSNSLPNKFVLNGISATTRQQAYLSNSKSIDVYAYVTPSVKIGTTTSNGTQTTILRQDDVSSSNSTSFTDTTQGFSSSQVGQSFTKSNFSATLGITTQLRFDGNELTTNYPQIRVTQGYITIAYTPIFTCTATNVEGCTTATVSSSEVQEGNSVTFTATKPSNYSFLGWFSDFECTQLVSSNLSYTTTPSDDLTLFAKAVLMYSVSVNADELCTVSASTAYAENGDSVTVTCTPIDDMKEFVGWYSNAGRTSLVSTSNPYTFNINADTTLYAKCKLKYEMYLKVNGSWIKCSAVYKKIDGAWVEQENLSGLFDTTKNYVKNDV